MTGSLQVKYDTYYIVINTKKKNGKRKQKWYPTGLPVKGNKKKAEQMLREKLREEEKAAMQAPKSEILFSDAIRSWLSESSIRVDDVTLQGYESHCDLHILPYFDALGVKLVDVDRRVLQEYINLKKKAGRTDGCGGLSAASLKQHKNVLNQTLKMAVRDHLIAFNPCEQVILPKAVKHQGHFYTAEQLNDLLAEIKNERLYPVIYITAVYGLRRSELLGLKWDSINFDLGTMTICHTVAKVSKIVEKDKTKNESSFRSFPLTPAARAIFEDAAEQAAENRRLFGKEYHLNDYVFKWEDGRPYSPDYISHAFNNLLKRYDFPHIRFHELRHSCASMLLANGFGLKDVQEWMGHSDIKITANIYGHLDTKRKEGMANGIQNLLPAN